MVVELILAYLPQEWHSSIRLKRREFQASSNSGLSRLVRSTLHFLHIVFLTYEIRHGPVAYSAPLRTILKLRYTYSLSLPSPPFLAVQAFPLGLAHIPQCADEFFGCQFRIALNGQVSLVLQSIVYVR